MVRGGTAGAHPDRHNHRPDPHIHTRDNGNEHTTGLRPNAKQGSIVDARTPMCRSYWIVDVTRDMPRAFYIESVGKSDAHIEAAHPVDQNTSTPPLQWSVGHYKTHSGTALPLQ